MLSLAHARGGAQEHGRPLAGRDVAPGFLGLDSHLERLRRGLPVREVMARENLGAVGRVAVLEKAAGPEAAAADDEGDLDASLAIDAREGGLEGGTGLGLREIGERLVAKVFQHGRGILSPHRDLQGIAKH